MTRTTTGRRFWAWAPAGRPDTADGGRNDGIAPNQPYNRLSPPPQEAADNKQPKGVQQVVQPGKGASIATPDSQAQLNANQGAFPAGQAVTIDIQPPQAASA